MVMPDEASTEMFDEKERLLRRVAHLEARERQLLETQRRWEKRTDPEIIQLERLHALEAMSRGVAHNFNNLLVGVMGYAQLIEMQSGEATTVKNAREIVRCADRARELVQRLSLSVGTVGRGESEILPLESIVHSVLDATRPRWKDEAEARGIPIQFVTDLDEAAGLSCFSGDLHHTLVHLIFNAVDALSETGGTITLKASRQNNKAALQVIDDGSGMDEQTRIRIFEPFFTTKQDVGSGLGLSVVYRNVIEAGGEIQVDSKPNQGTVVTLSLPILEPPRRTSRARKPVAIRPEAAKKILVIDDEHQVREVMLQALSDFEVSLFSSGEEALRHFSRGHYGLALIDLGMPAMPGNEVARRLKAIDPDLVAVLVSGWELEDDDPILDHFDGYIPKPFKLSTIRSLLNSGTGS